MRCTVVWIDKALDDLAKIWTQAASSRNAVRDAANEIDRLLRYQAASVGWIDGDYRRLRVDPLDVAYVVSLGDCLVTVYEVSFVP